MKPLEDYLPDYSWDNLSYLFILLVKPRIFNILIASSSSSLNILSILLHFEWEIERTNALDVWNVLNVKNV